MLWSPGFGYEGFSVAVLRLDWVGVGCVGLYRRGSLGFIGSRRLIFSIRVHVSYESSLLIHMESCGRSSGPTLIHVTSRRIFTEEIKRLKLAKYADGSTQSVNQLVSLF